MGVTFGGDCERCSNVSEVLTDKRSVRIQLLELGLSCSWGAGMCQEESHFSREYENQIGL